MKGNQKIKSIESKKDAIIFLNQMIILIDKRMKRFKKNIDDLKNQIKIRSKKKKVLTTTYHEYHDRIDSSTLYLFNLFGDETRTAVSYKQFRKIMKKKENQGHKEFALLELEEEIKKILDEFRSMRNWSHHIPQSLLNSQIHYMKTEENLGEFIDLQFSKENIYVLEWEFHEIGWLKQLYETSENLYFVFEKVYKVIKKDYSTLVGKDLNMIYENQNISRPHKFSLIGENSYKINKGVKI